MPEVLISFSWATLARKYPLSLRSIPTMDSATWCRTPAAASAARRLRPEVSKNSSTALSSNEGELARSITTCVPATACLSPAPVMVLMPVFGEAATTSWLRWRRMATVFEPIRPVPPMTTIFMVYPPDNRSVLPGPRYPPKAVPADCPMPDARERHESGPQRLPVRRQVPQKTDTDARRFFGVVFEAVVPVRVLEPDLEHGVAGERQPVAAGCQADHAVPGGVAAGALDDHSRRHLVLVLERLQPAVVFFQEILARPPKRIRKPRRHGNAGEIRRLPELGLGGRQMDAQVRAQPLFHAVGEQPATVVHVHVGQHHVRHG